MVAGTATIGFQASSPRCAVESRDPAEAHRSGLDQKVICGVVPGVREGSGAMKKGGILNPAICSLLAELGQSDELLIVDAAYPLPTDGHVIDLTLTPGIPRLLDVLRAVTEELVVDAVTVPVEIKEYSPRIYQEILKIVGETDIDEVPFHEFKEQALDVKGIIRSAEFSPYASVRLVAGSAF
jgi:D-ribose pyranase